jgi:hypothetical protein
MEGSVSRDPTVGGTGRAVPAEPTRILPVTANPAALGLAGFALTTFVLSFFNADLVSSRGEPIVLGLALAYGGLAQLLAGMWEFRTGNTFGATAFTSYGAFWLSFWAFNQFFAKDIKDPADVGNAVGLYLIGWGIFTAYMWVASFRVSVAVNLVFLLLAITFIVLGIGNAGDSTGVIKLGGWFGIATAIVAWYASFATVTNATFNRVVLPVKELNR